MRNISKRSIRTGDRTPYQQPTKRFYKHYMIDTLCGNEEEIKTWFNYIAIIGIHDIMDSEECPDMSQRHYHILGEAKFTNRHLRDMSIERLNIAGIQGGMTSRDIFMCGRQKHILDAKHFENTIKYIKRQCGSIIQEAESPVYAAKYDVFTMLDDLCDPYKFTEAQMEQFRERFPITNQWRKLIGEYRLPSQLIEKLQCMEEQRQHEDKAKAFTQLEKEILIWNYPYMKIIKKLKYMVEQMPQNTGCCLIMCGKANTLKSTTARILAKCYGRYCVWPGSQWIQRDILKFDTPARKNITTIVCEEMQWYDVAKKITLENTLNSIKEQLTGAGIDVRTAKTKSNATDDLKLKIERLFISMNPSERVNYRILKEIIMKKEEYSKRFIVYNMDQHIDEITELIKHDSAANHWQECSDRMEELLAKALTKPGALDQIEYEYDENSVDKDQYDVRIELTNKLKELEDELPSELLDL